MSLDSVLLIGGSGFLGLHLIQQFSEVSPSPEIHIFDIRPIPENPPKVFTFDPKAIHFHKGDITSPVDIQNAIRESKCSVIVHSASPMHGQSQEIYEKVNVEGTRNLLKVAKDERIKAFVYTSSAGVIFDGSDIYNGDESFPIPEVAMDGYNETKAIAEKMVLDANSSNDEFFTVALRPAGIFGPGDRQLVPGLRDVLKAGQTKFQIGDNNNLFDWSYAGNVADAHVLAAKKLLNVEARSKIGGEKFFVTNDSPCYFWTLARAVWKADGHVDDFNIVLSRSAAIAIGYIGEFVSKFTGKPPGLTPFRARVVCAVRYHNISKAKELLDYKPKVSIEEGIRLTLQWMDEEKK